HGPLLLPALPESGWRPYEKSHADTLRRCISSNTGARRVCQGSTKMILEDAYRANMRHRNLAANTVETNISALRRIERYNNVNIEDDFSKDRLDSLLQRLTYTREDERTGRPNPTNLASEPSRLFITLGWYRSVLDRYRTFRLGGDVS